MSRLEHPEALHRALEGEPGLAPPGLEATAARLTAAKVAVRDLPRVVAPPGFAAGLAARLLAEPRLDEVEARLAGLPRAEVPAGFAAATALRVAEFAEAEAPLSGQPGGLELRLRAMPRVAAPPGFAAALAARIAADAGEARNPAPLYVLGGTLGAAALAAISLAWPYAQTAAAAALEIGRALPAGLLVTYALAALLALVAASGSVRPRLVTALAAFALGAAVVWPQLLPFFGPLRVEPGRTTSALVRFGGDLAVGGHVRGAAICLGCSVRVAEGGRVDGPIVTFLGDVNLARGAAAASVSTVLGAVGREGAEALPVRAADLPGLGAANALRPVRELLRADAWPLLLLGLAATAVGLLFSAPGAAGPLERRFRGEPGRAIGVGLGLLLLAPPLGALAGLTLVGAPAALLLTVLVGLAYAAGLGLGALELGRLLGRRLGVPARPAFEASLGLGALLALLAAPPAALTVWLLVGAWGAGAIALEWRSLRSALGPE